ncbi:MAG TPA: toxin-antitoxin system HicB family antitoxin [Mycobacterium sp.]
MNRYAYRVEWSPDEEAYVGSCIEVPSLKRAAPTAEQAIADLAGAVDQYVEDVQACGEEAPTPLSERSYSGTFVVRTSPELRGRLAIEAAEQRVSMNQWVVQKLSGRDLGSGSFGFD